MLSISTLEMCAPDDAAISGSLLLRHLCIRLQTKLRCRSPSRMPLSSVLLIHSFLKCELGIRTPADSHWTSHSCYIIHAFWHLHNSHLILTLSNIIMTDAKKPKNKTKPIWDSLFCCSCCVCAPHRPVPSRPLTGIFYEAEEGFTDISTAALYDTEQAACLLTSQRHQLIFQSGL